MDKVSERKEYLSRLLDKRVDPKILVSAYGFTEFQVKNWPKVIEIERINTCINKSPRHQKALDAFGVRNFYGLKAKLSESKDPLKLLLSVPGVGRKTAYLMLEALEIM